MNLIFLELSSIRVNKALNVSLIERERDLIIERWFSSAELFPQGCVKVEMNLRAGGPKALRGDESEVARSAEDYTSP
jgi:hypothetical protein